MQTRPDDPFRPFKGVLVGLLLSIPIWLIVAVTVYLLVA